MIMNFITELKYFCGTSELTIKNGFNNPIKDLNNLNLWTDLIKFDHIAKSTSQTRCKWNKRIFYVLIWWKQKNVV